MHKLMYCLPVPGMLQAEGERCVKTMFVGRQIVVSVVRQVVEGKRLKPV